MSPLRPYSTGTTLLAAAAFLALATWTQPGLAQPHTPDPYKPYNSQYQDFVFPTAPINPALPGSARREIDRFYGNSANQFGDYTQSLSGTGLGFDPLDPSGRFSGGLGVPYYESNRRYDQNFGRIYAPNREADEDFNRRQQERTRRYFEALKERDPKKRAQLIREIDQEVIRAGRGGRSAAGAGRESSAAEPARPESERVRRPVEAPSARRRSQRSVVGRPGRSPLPPRASNPVTGPRPTSPLTRSSPTEVLERSERLGGVRETPPALQPAPTTTPTPAPSPGATPPR